MKLPNRKAGFFDQLPGALFAALGWYLFSYGFSIYIDYCDSFNMYGSLTTLVLLMFWLYAVMYIVLIGLELNQWLEVQIFGRD
jgi:membrane protein